MQNAAVSGTPTSVRRVVRLARQGLAADAAFLALAGDEQVLLVLDGDVDGFGAPPGSCFPMPITLCDAMLHRRIPRIVTDTRAHPIAARIPMVEAAGIGCYGGVPVTDDGGATVATLCVVGHDADLALRGTDAHYLSALAGTLRLDDVDWGTEPEPTVDLPADPLDALDAHGRARVRLTVEVAARLGFDGESLAVLAGRAVAEDHVGDGSGREGSPLPEAILSAVGAYQALVQRRPDGRTLTGSAARSVLRRGAGSTFSAAAVAALFAVVAGDQGALLAAA